MSHTDSLRIHRFEPLSLANGPGRRAVLWLQGCTLACPGCFNPATHAMDGGKERSLCDLLAEIDLLRLQIDGLTISGGEPLLQLPALTYLLQSLHQHGPLSVILFSGFTWPQIEAMPGSAALLAEVDVLLAGPYQAEQRLAHSLRGSANKTLHLLSSRHSLAELHATPTTEIWIDKTGQIVLSGIDPLAW
jgi:anaerobic ribonucleoside-triphosphate reductase activating protein